MTSGAKEDPSTAVGPSGTSALAPRRRWLAVVAIGLALAVVTTVMAGTRPSLGTALVVYLLVIVVAAVAGGLWVAVGAALASFLLANWFLTPPYHTFTVEQRDSLVALVVFVAVALLVSATVELGAQQRVRAARSDFELQALSRFTSEPLSGTSLTTALTQVRDLFGMESVALRRHTDDGDVVVGSVGQQGVAEPALQIEIDSRLTLVASGPEVFAEDRGLLRRLADTAARAYEGERLVAEAARTAQLEEVDRLRAALLAAVGHDLRTPLAGVKAAVSSLRQADVEWSPDERAELLATIEESADRLDDLISNLLAMSRLQAGAVVVDIQPVAVDEVVARALLHTSRAAAGAVKVEVNDDLPPAVADAGLLERVVANLVDNAQRFNPPGRPVEVAARMEPSGHVAVEIVDHGPGPEQEDWERMFMPFHRAEGSPGVGLGLAIARGFTEAMQGTLTPSATSGGGLTMTVRLPIR